MLRVIRFNLFTNMSICSVHVSVRVLVYIAICVIILEVFELPLAFLVCPFVLAYSIVEPDAILWD